MNYFVLFFKNWKILSVFNFTIFKFTSFPGFSMAEVAITLGIIGIIALKVLPHLYIEYIRIKTVTSVIRAYSIYSNGFNQAINENGTPDNWGLSDYGDTSGIESLNTILSKQFKLTKNCGTDSGCFPDIYYKNLKGLDNETNLNQDPSYLKYLLADGSSMAISQWSGGCSLNWGDSQPLQNVCGIMVFDTNGAKNPNTYGLDTFGFAFTKYGLVPLGSAMQTGAYPFNGFCSEKSNANFKYENGLSCTAWVMYNQNMDYSKCTGLNWNSKLECKAK